MSGKNKPAVPEDPDCSCFGAARKSDSCPPVRNVTHPLRYYEFTQDEIKALEECDKESFYRRCIPFSALFASVTYAAIKYGFLSRHPQFGVFPKLLVAVAVGHIYGRLSYIPICEKKLRCELLPESSYLRKTMKEHYERHHPPPPKK